LSQTKESPVLVCHVVLGLGDSWQTTGMKPIQLLITGANGFIGLPLCMRIAQCGMLVRAVVRKQCDLPAGVEPFHFLGLEDKAGLLAALDGVKVVVHAAARAHVMHDELADPLTEYRRVNVQGTTNLALQSAEAGVRRFVFISSIGVNGNQTDHPFSEADHPQPHDDYAISKHEAEQALWQVARDTGMEVVVIRPPLVYGPGAPGNFASLVRWVRRGLPLPLGAVHNRRSLVALDNLVDFIALCASPERSPQAANQTFLVSDGDDVSTTELLRRVAQAYGVPARLLPVPVGLMRGTARLLGKTAVADRLFGSLQVDASKARDLLGWIPPVTMHEQLRKMASHDASS
jgi:nucleoside-diphosphate-sugar epimerase